MLLKTILCVSVLPTLVLLVGGCGVSVDERAGRPNARERGGREALAVVRIDADPRRAARAEYLLSDPRLRPSPREQREARAFVKAEADLMSSGNGFVTYRSDGSADLPHKVEFVAQKGALTIDFTASENLNRVDGVPHALLLVVYHMSHTAAFEDLARTGEGVRRLLEGEVFSVSAKRAEKHYVQPGASGKLRFDRPDDGKYIGIVAGYATPDSGTCVFTTEYGLGQWRKQGDTAVSKRKIMFSPLPTHLNMWLEDTGMVVKNTGPAHTNLRGVSTLMARQVREMTWDESPLQVMTNFKAR